MDTVNTAKTGYELSVKEYNRAKKAYEEAGWNKIFVKSTYKEAEQKMNTAKGIYAGAISLASFGYHDSIDDYNKLQGMKDLAGTGYSEVQPNIQYWWNYGQANGDLSHIKAYAIGSEGIKIFELTGDGVVSLESQLASGFNGIEKITIPLSIKDKNNIHTNVTNNEKYISKIKELIKK